MNDDQLRACFQICEVFAAAAGADERVEDPAPICGLNKKYNISPSTAC